MLAYVFIFLLGLTPALQAVFDLPLQLALQRAVLAACLAWLFLRAFGPGLPRALAGRKYFPLWAAAGLSFLSVLASPFRGDILNEWGNYAAGLLIFLFASFVDREGRDRVERGMLWGAWLVFGLALAQAFFLGNLLSRPPLTNLNALALYAVMMVPLALERRAWALAVAMVVMVVWTQSLGAALAGLAAAGIYAASRPGGFRENSPLLAALALLAAAVFYLLQADSVAGRLAWWGSAWDMFAARPLAGFGHASFAWAQAAFQPAGAFREHSIYAHNYYLEFLAENGLPAAVAWFWVIFGAVRARAGLARYSLIAALVHSLVDFGISVPANFWIFCWLLSGREEGTPASVPPRRAAAGALLLACLLGWGLLRLDLASLAFEKARAAALSAYSAGDRREAVAALLPAAAGPFRGPALELLGRFSLAEGANFRAAVYFEGALLENRYSPRAWAALGKIYSAPGLEAQAADLTRRRLEVFE